MFRINPLFCLILTLALAAPDAINAQDDTELDRLSEVCDGLKDTQLGLADHLIM